MHHPAWPPICSSCDENIWWAYYFLSTIIIVKEIDSSQIIFLKDLRWHDVHRRHLEVWEGGRH